MIIIDSRYDVLNHAVVNVVSSLRMLLMLLHKLRVIPLVLLGYGVQLLPTAFKNTIYIHSA